MTMNLSLWLCFSFVTGLLPVAVRFISYGSHTLYNRLEYSLGTGHVFIVAAMLA
jgi:hypothetical protein